MSSFKESLGENFKFICWAIVWAVLPVLIIEGASFFLMLAVVFPAISSWSVTADFVAAHHGGVFLALCVAALVLELIGIAFYSSFKDVLEESKERRKQRKCEA